MKILLTPKQIREIYDAGRQRGSDEEYGSSWNRGEYLDELKNAMVWNGKYSILPDINAAGFEAIQFWWKAFEKEVMQEEPSSSIDFLTLQSKRE